MVALVLALAGAAWAASGVLRTAEGQNFEGQVLIAPGGFKVLMPTGATQQVALARVAWVQMEPRENPSGSSAKLAGNGLLGTYFARPDLTGKAVHRRDDTINFEWGESWPMPGLPADNFSVRWTAQLEAPKTGEYTFYVLCDDGVRLWIKDQLLLDRWQRQPPGEHSAKRNMTAGKKYDFKLEYFEGVASALVKLWWAGPGVSRTIIPKECFSTASPLAANAQADGPPPSLDERKPPPARRGVLLRDGTYLGLGVRAVEQDAVKFYGGPKDLAVPIRTVARILYSDLTPEMAARIEGRRPGVLMHSRDFVDGEVRSITDRQVKVSSVLFGLRTVEVGGKVAAVVLGDITPTRSRYVVQTRDGSLLRVEEVECERSSLVIKDAPYRGWRLWQGEVVELWRRL